MRGARAKPKTGFWYNVQKWPVPESDGASLTKKLHLDPKPDVCQGGRKSTGGASSITTDCRKKRSHGDVIADAFQSSTLSPSSSSVFRLVPF